MVSDVFLLMGVRGPTHPGFGLRGSGRREVTVRTGTEVDSGRSWEGLPVRHVLSL